jgi:hypothetical protein
MTTKALYCGSVSTRITVFPFEANIHPRLNVVVVLLTPPLWLKRAIFFVIFFLNKLVELILSDLSSNTNHIKKDLCFWNFVSVTKVSPWQYGIE